MFFHIPRQEAKLYPRQLSSVFPEQGRAQVSRKFVYTNSWDYITGAEYWCDAKCERLAKLLGRPSSSTLLSDSIRTLVRRRPMMLSDDSQTGKMQIFTKCHNLPPLVACLLSSVASTLLGKNFSESSSIWLLWVFFSGRDARSRRSRCGRICYYAKKLCAWDCCHFPCDDDDDVVGMSDYKCCYIRIAEA